MGCRGRLTRFRRREDTEVRKMYLAMARQLMVATEENGRWRADVRLEGLQPVCLAADPLRPGRIYCGTWGRGLWRSEDAGHSWRPVGDPVTDWTLSSFGDGIPHPHVTAVAVSTAEGAGGLGVVFAGTEPSALFRSEDGGETWRELEGLTELPSASGWSFPPRPHTSHVRWISPDPNARGSVYVSIEAGAVVRSADGGKTWEDRRPEGPLDAHTLATHPLAPGRLYAAAGDGQIKKGTGYAESTDGGNTWTKPNEGLSHHYLWGLAVDPANPDTVIVSAAGGAGKAHNPSAAESAVYRRTAGGPWQRAEAGLPEGRGTLVPILGTNPAEPGVFYCLSNKGVHRSADAGVSWEPVDLPWDESYRGQRHQALLVAEA
jgi:photosystem II stability/assembly factor-like uncharacterized protein